MGWYHSAVRNRLGVGTTGRMSAIKTFHEQSQPSIAAKAAAVEADIDDDILVETSIGEPSEGDAVQSMDDMEIRAEDLLTDDNLDRTLNPFYVADKQLYEAAQNPGISFTELLLGDPEQGFAVDHAALAVGYVPVEPVSAQVGILGSFSGATFDPEALMARMMPS